MEYLNKNANWLDHLLETRTSPSFFGGVEAILVV